MKKNYYLAILSVSFLYFACANKKSAGVDSVQEKLIGSWEWVSSEGGIDGGMLTPATEGYTQTIEMDKEGNYKWYQNGVLKATKKYTISSNKDKEAQNPYILSFNEKDSYSFRVTDTLWISEDCVDCFGHTYVRKKANDPNKPIIESDTLYNSGLDVYNNYLPPTFRAYVTDYVTGWSIPKQTAWEKYWWDQYKKDKSLVNFVPGDFNCDNNMDYAMILENPNGGTAAWAFLANGKDFDKELLEMVPKEEGPIGIGIELMPKGKHGDLNTNKTFDVKCEGVTIIFFEKAAHSYYLDKGKFKMLQTGD